MDLECLHTTVYVLSTGWFLIYYQSFKKFSSMKTQNISKLLPENGLCYLVTYIECDTSNKNCINCKSSTKILVDCSLCNCCKDD